MIEELKLQGDIFVSIGKSQIRKSLIELYSKRKQHVLVDSANTFASDAEIGFGLVVMAGPVINPCARIRKECFINTAYSFDNDNISDFCHV